MISHCLVFGAKCAILPIVTAVSENKCFIIRELLLSQGLDLN